MVFLLWLFCLAARIAVYIRGGAGDPELIPLRLDGKGGKWPSGLASGASSAMPWPPGASWEPATYKCPPGAASHWQSWPMRAPSWKVRERETSASCAPGEISCREARAKWREALFFAEKHLESQVISCMRQTSRVYQLTAAASGLTMVLVSFGALYDLQRGSGLATGLKKGS